MKHTLKKIVTMALCLLMLAMIIPARPTEAAGVCREISGKSTKTTTFTVKTGSRWLAKKDVLTLTQKKGVLKAERVFSLNTVYKTFKKYEDYTVVVKKMSGKKTISTKQYSFSKASLKIKLDKNSTYVITVSSPYSRDGGFTKSPLFYNYFSTLGSAWWSPVSWKTPSTWRVKSTKGVLSCS